jgi:hypothetical protein
VGSYNREINMSIVLFPDLFEPRMTCDMNGK